LLWELTKCRGNTRVLSPNRLSFSFTRSIWTETFLQLARWFSSLLNKILRSGYWKIYIPHLDDWLIFPFTFVILLLNLFTSLILSCCLSPLCTGKSSFITFSSYLYQNVCFKLFFISFSLPPSLTAHYLFIFVSFLHTHTHILKYLYFICCLSLLFVNSVLLMRMIFIMLFQLFLWYCYFLAFY
jgi:hypothetical protein